MTALVASVVVLGSIDGKRLAHSHALHWGVDVWMALMLVVIAAAAWVVLRPGVSVVKIDSDLHGQPVKR
jgi:hypothetical protein